MELNSSEDTKYSSGSKNFTIKELDRGFYWKINDDVNENLLSQVVVA
jgi:hypothetical protein